jgi:vacuolar-type H+-ATPase subunit E/Vma4
LLRDICALQLEEAERDAKEARLEAKKAIAEARREAAEALARCASMSRQLRMLCMDP